MVSARAVTTAAERDSALSAAASAALNILLRKAGLTVRYPQVWSDRTGPSRPALQWTRFLLPVGGLVDA
ncbi:hypothetical protein ADL25_37835 [Streptomyces sp. NRRL F-5122]|nr:hypothetical protein ADL25_37835 [Streptomyces sp. NRRL F-5122]